MQELRAAAARKADTLCCWCCDLWDVEGEGGLPVRRHSYRGHRVNLWRTADCKRNTNTVTSQAVYTTRGRTRAYPAKTDTVRFRLMAGLEGRVFACFSILTVFGPKRTKCM